MVRSTNDFVFICWVFSLFLCFPLHISGRFEDISVECITYRNTYSSITCHPQLLYVQVTPSFSVFHEDAWAKEGRLM